MWWVVVDGERAVNHMSTCSVLGSLIYGSDYSDIRFVTTCWISGLRESLLLGSMSCHLFECVGVG